MKMYWHKEGYHSSIRPINKSSIIAGSIVLLAVFQPILSISAFGTTSAGLTPYELTKFVMNKNPELNKGNLMNISIYFLIALYGSIVMFFMKGFEILPSKLDMMSVILAISSTVLGFILVNEVASSIGGLIANLFTGGVAVYLPIGAVIAYFYLER